MIHVIVMARYGESEVVKALDESATALGFTLRPKQTEAVVAFVRGHDVFVSLPTGMHIALKIRI